MPVMLAKNYVENNPCFPLKNQFFFKGETGVVTYPPDIAFPKLNDTHQKALS